MFSDDQGCGSKIFRTPGKIDSFAEARGAESRNDFIHKLGIVRKELNESLEWIKMVQRKGMAPGELIQHLRSEYDQQCRIISASRNRAEQNATKKLR